MRLNRLPPIGPAGAYKTYQIVQPRMSHFRRATCAEVGCGAYERGWKTVIDETTAIGQERADYIRKVSGRRFVEERVGLGVTTFTFPPGQRCFRSDEHVVPLEREPLYFVRGGDWRGNPLGGQPFRHTRGDFWVEDFAEHQTKIAREIERG